LGLGVSFFFVNGINFASWALLRVSVEFWEWYKLFCQHAYTRLLLVEKRDRWLMASARSLVVKDMHPVNMTQPSMNCCATVGERLSEGRAYLLVRCSLPDANPRTRRRVLTELLERRYTIGLIEWWTHGSIARKPWREFYVIVIQDISQE